MSKKLNAKKQNNEQEIMYKPSETEPLFAMAKTESGITILCGKYKVTNKLFNSYEEAESYIASKPYELIINTTCLVTKLNINENESKNKNPQDK